MMGRKSKQIWMVMIDMEEIIPKDHLLRKIKEKIDFDFIYEEAEEYYSRIGRPSIDPVCLIKMLLVGYLYGIRSERMLEEEITLNMAYRWFCGFDLMDIIPDHSTFSQNRKRRFNDSKIFRQIFNRIVGNCIETGLINGETSVSDGNFIPANGRANAACGTPGGLAARKRGHVVPGRTGTPAPLSARPAG